MIDYKITSSDSKIIISEIIPEKATSKFYTLYNNILYWTFWSFLIMIIMISIRVKALTNRWNLGAFILYFFIAAACIGFLLISVNDPKYIEIAEKFKTYNILLGIVMVIMTMILLNNIIIILLQNQFMNNVINKIYNLHIIITVIFRVLFLFDPFDKLICLLITILIILKKILEYQITKQLPKKPIEDNINKI